MDVTVLLLNMTMLLLIGWVCSVIFKRLKMPTAIGYIICGIILSNYWGGENADTEWLVGFLADLGLVLMMFCIGMELNLKKLSRMGPFAMMVVMIQVPIMLAGGFIGGTMLGLDALQAIIFGAIISGSSTAVVTIVLAEQERISHTDVETLVFITVIEDVAQVRPAGLPVVIGSGITAQNAAKFGAVADGLIVGTYIKRDGNWRNPVDVDRVRAVAAQLESIAP